MKTACGNGSVVTAEHQAVLVLLLPITPYQGSAGRTQLRVGALSVVLKLRSVSSPPVDRCPLKGVQPKTERGSREAELLHGTVEKCLWPGNDCWLFLSVLFFTRARLCTCPWGVYSEPDSWLFMPAGNVYNPKFLQGSTFSLQVFLGVNSHSLS